MLALKRAGWARLCMGLLAAVCALSLSLAQAQAPLPYDETEAQAIDRSLMCPVCPAETIDQAQVEVARQMRQRVRELLAEGKTRQEVLDYFAERYGPGILAAPPQQGATLAAWLVPPLAVAAALAAGFFVLRAMRRPAPPTAAAGEGELEPYLSLVDERLAQRGKAEPPSEGDSAAKEASAPRDGA